MLKIVLGSKNAIKPFFNAKSDSTQQGLVKLFFPYNWRGYIPRQLLLASFLLGGILLLLVVLILGIMRREVSSAYRVSYQEFVTSPSGVNSSTLYHMYPDGSHVRQFVPLEYSIINGGVSWSPQGDEIVFMHLTERTQPSVQRTHIHDMTATEVLFTTRTDSPQPQWSPDGQYFALNLRGAIAIWDVQTQKMLIYHESVEEIFYHSVTWLPQESAVLFVSRQNNIDELLKMNVPSGDTVSLTANMSEFEDHLMQTPHVSPNGRWVAIQLNNPDQGTSQVVLFDLTNNTVRQIISTPAGQINPRWSPDSDWLIYNSGFVFGQPGGLVYRVKLANGTTQQLPQQVHTFSGVVWSPDGRWLYYPLFENNTWNIYRSDVVGGQVEQLTNSPNAHLFPTVSPLLDRDWHGWLFGLLSGLFILACCYPSYLRCSVSS